MLVGLTSNKQLSNAISIQFLRAEFIPSFCKSQDYRHIHTKIISQSLYFYSSAVDLDKQALHNSSLSSLSVNLYLYLLFFVCFVFFVFYFISVLLVVELEAPHLHQSGILLAVVKSRKELQC